MYALNNDDLFVIVFSAEETIVPKVCIYAIIFDDEGEVQY